MRINIEINLFAHRTITSFLFSLETNDISTLFANWSRKLQIRLWNLKQIFIQSDKLMICVQQWIVTVDICQKYAKVEIEITLCWHIELIYNIWHYNANMESHTSIQIAEVVINIYLIKISTLWIWF